MQPEITGMNRTIVIMLAGVVIILNAAFAAQPASQPAKIELQDDPPILARPKPGRITGQVTPAGKIKTLRAVSRITGQTYRPEQFDENTGRFSFQNMPGDSAYDICVVTTDGREFEGIDLEFISARLDRLAEMRRVELGVPSEKIEEQFSIEDVRAIQEFVASWQDFMDTKRILYIQCQGNRATVLIELMRTREFHKSRNQGQAQSQLVWRIELWYMQKQGGGWAKLPNVERLLRRERSQLDEWQKISVEYYPQLTARLDAAGGCEPINLKIPETPDPTRGRPANTEIDMLTKPNVLPPLEKTR